MRWVAAALLLLVWPVEADAPFSLGFRPGVEPLVIGDDPGFFTSARVCGQCHAEVYDDWAASGHASAWTSPLFQAGYLAEPQAFCVYCHTPLAAQSAEALQNLPWVRAAQRGARSTLPRALPDPVPETRASEGVTCVTCHLRDGVVLTPGPVEGAAHPTRAEPALTDGALCRDCHEFAMPAFIDGQLHWTEEKMQSTYTEWRDWRAAGGAEGCTDCHMPGGRHLFHGASDRERLAASVTLDARQDGDRLTFTVASRGVGHSLPSGDLFRHLSLEVERRGAWEELATFGRSFELFDDPALGGIRKRLASDSSLQPGVPVTLSTPAAGVAAWRLRYHDGSPTDERRGLLPLDEITAVLAQGELRALSPAAP